MPENLMSYIAVTVTIIWFVGILVWLFRRQFCRTKTVHAIVVHKQISESFSKYSGDGKVKRYYVSFLIDGKRRCFRVSEFSYRGYQKGKIGTLKYKGNRLVDFS